MSVRTALRPIRSRARRILTAGVVTATAATVGVTGLAGTANASEADDMARNRELAREMIDNDKRFACFEKIVDHESDWRHTATNPESGAYGLVQALPAKRMKTVGDDWKTNPETQIKWGLKYMDERYGGPCKAWDFWEEHGWY